MSGKDDGVKNTGNFNGEAGGVGNGPTDGGFECAGPGDAADSGISRDGKSRVGEAPERGKPSKPSCCRSELEDDIILYVDGELSAPEKATLEAHVRECCGCRGVLESYAKLDKAAAGLFVTDRPLPKVRLEKAASAFDPGAFFRSLFTMRPAFAFAAVALLALAAFLVIRVHSGRDGKQLAAFGDFDCSAYRVGVKQGPSEARSGVSPVSGGAVITALAPGRFSSASYNISFSKGACAAPGPGGISLVVGKIEVDYFKKPALEEFSIVTQNASVRISGTKLSVSYFDRVTEISVSEGSVTVIAAGSHLYLSAGEGAIVKGDAAPERTSPVVSPSPSNGGPVDPTVRSSSETGIVRSPVPIAGTAPVTISPAPTEGPSATAEIVSAGNEAGTVPAGLKKAPPEKILEYEVDLESMDERTKKLFFGGKKK